MTNSLTRFEMKDVLAKQKARSRWRWPSVEIQRRRSITAPAFSRARRRRVDGEMGLLISADVGRRRDGIAVVIPRANVEVVWRGLQIDPGIQPERSGQEAIRRRARLRAVMPRRVPSACAASARIGHLGIRHDGACFLADGKHLGERVIDDTVDVPEAAVVIEVVDELNFGDVRRHLSAGVGIPSHVPLVRAAGVTDIVGNQAANWKRPAKAKDIARLRVIRVGADRRNPYRVVVDLENDIRYDHDAERLVILVVVFGDIITDDIAIPRAAANHPRRARIIVRIIVLHRNVDRSPINVVRGKITAEPLVWRRLHVVDFVELNDDPIRVPGHDAGGAAAGIRVATDVVDQVVGHLSNADGAGDDAVARGGRGRVGIATDIIDGITLIDRIADVAIAAISRNAERIGTGGPLLAMQLAIDDLHIVECVAPASSKRAETSNKNFTAPISIAIVVEAGNLDVLGNDRIARPLYANTYGSLRTTRGEFEVLDNDTTDLATDEKSLEAPRAVRYPAGAASAITLNNDRIRTDAAG